MSHRGFVRFTPLAQLCFLSVCAPWLVSCGRGGSARVAAEPTQRLVLDYRNGWYHFATGQETVQHIADLYRRDARLVSQINRFDVGQRPAQGASIYVPPVHDRAELRAVLERINRDPRAVPQVPPALSYFDNLPLYRPRTGGASPQPTRPPPLPPSREITTPAHFNWPVEGEITRRFALAGSDRFRGITIAADARTPVRASRPGRVIYAGDLRGYGKTVIMDHGDGYSTVYGYNDRVLVKPRQDVSAGDRIATVGRPSRNAKSQLFFQIRKNARPIDPMRFLQ